MKKINRIYPQILSIFYTINYKFYITRCVYVIGGKELILRNYLLDIKCYLNLFRNIIVFAKWMYFLWILIAIIFDKFS